MLGSAIRIIMRSILLKLARSPRTISILSFDRIFVPLWLRLLGVDCGRNCRFRGMPVIGLAPGSRIMLGNNISVNSRFDSNAAGLPHPTIFAALAPESYILIGDRTGISGASIVSRCGITIGERVFIGAGACIWDTDFHPLDAEQRRQHATRDARCAPIRIDDEAFIGARSLILKGVSIGQGAVIGAGAVVTRDVRAGDVVAGNPARVVGSVNSEKRRV